MTRAIPRLMLAIRIFLAVVFIGYGGSKLAGGQFFYGDWAATKSTVSGPFLVWLFYGYSPVYGHLVGLFEFIPAILLLFPRTATAAAAALFAVSLNITLMDFAFGFPAVKYASAIYTGLCAVLMAYDSKKLLLLLTSRQETEAAFSAVLRQRAASTPISTASPRRWSKPAWIASALIFVFCALFIVNAVSISRDLGPTREATAALVDRGFKESNLKLVRVRMTGMFLKRTAKVDFQVLNTDPSKMIRVEAERPNGLIGWRITNVIDGPPGAALPQ